MHYALGDGITRKKFDEKSVLRLVGVLTLFLSQGCFYYFNALVGLVHKSPCLKIKQGLHLLVAALPTRLCG